MKCSYSKDLLALYVEGDLDDSQELAVKRHLRTCAECERFCEELTQSQLQLKTLRLGSVSASSLASVRQGILAQIDDAHESLGRAIRIERFLLQSLRSPIYVAAAVALIVVASVSLVGFSGQSGSGAAAAQPAAMFVGKDLLRPENYREWVFVGSSMGLGYAPNISPNAGGGMFHNVYIDPAAYQAYSRTGKFPEGTVLVLEMFSAAVKQEPGLQGSYEKDFMSVEASVKDTSRFTGGWGYFGFTDRSGKLLDRAEVQPESAGCRTCHEQRGEKDHVFTQFYPVLRFVGAIMTP